MLAILRRELSAYFNSAIGYIVMAVFYFFSGTYFYVYCLYYKTSNMTYIVNNMFLIILFVIPIITMKSFSEEKRQRTDQALLTAPISLFEVVAGKFLGAFTMYSCCIAIFLLYAIVLSFFGAVQWSVVLCTILGLLLLGGALISIDLFVSALTESQVIAAIVSLAVGLLIYLMDSLIGMSSSQFLSTVLSAVSFNNNYQNFTYGILNLSNIVFFLSVMAIFSFLTIRVFEKKRWS